MKDLQLAYSRNISCLPALFYHVVSYSEIIFLPSATKLGQGNIFSSVCQEFCSQGGSTPPGQVPPWAGTSRHPWAGTPPGQVPPMVNERAVRILLECILVRMCGGCSICYSHLNRISESLSLRGGDKWVHYKCCPESIETNLCITFFRSDKKILNSI